MATSHDYIEFVMDQMETAHTGLHLWYRPMFGEFCVYSGEKPLLFVCDNTVFVKKLECVSQLLADAAVGEPYPGAKGYVVLDIEDVALVREVLLQLDLHKPMPKPKKRRCLR
ncbi:MAG: transcriptional regulator [Tidjanibacter sp.]|nr:transcriptional regulator [Tidjanibacter sp.]